MRPVLGVSLELVVLAGFLALTPLVPAGLPFAFYTIVAQLLATYLVHCPAHYLVGTAFGIRFRRISLGRTTLAHLLPKALAGLARMLPVLTLSTERGSLSGVSKRRAATMYASGTVASVSSAVVIAIATTWAEPLPYSELAWAVALVYLAFDLVFSPRSGDLMRARAALRRPLPAEPVQSQE